MMINLTFINKQHQLEIDRPHLLRRLGYPKNYNVPDHIEDTMQWTANWYKKNGNPWLQIYDVDINLSNEKIYIDSLETQAPKVFKRFQKHQVKKAVLIASTAGSNIDKKISDLWSDYPDKAFFLDAYGASIAEKIVSFAIDYINKWSALKGANALARYSPGYPGWELKEQLLLMKIIQKKAIKKVPITISKTALLTPLKSQLSLVGICKGKQKENQITIECMKCNFTNCSCKGDKLYIKT